MPRMGIKLPIMSGIIEKSQCSHFFQFEQGVRCSSDFVLMRYFSKSYLLGLIFIFTCACIWAGASVLIQYIYRNLDFKSPFLVTYLANSLLVFYLPFYKLTSTFGKKQESAQQGQVLNPIGHVKSENDSSDSTEDSTVGKGSHKDAIRIAMIICPVWFFANCLYNYSLLMTSNSSSTIISNLSAAFTLAFSWMASLEEITYSKLIGILVCFAGAVTVGLQDSSGGDSQQSILGDVVALLASVGYGVYTTLLRYHIHNDEEMSMQLVLGYIGLFNAILLSPVILALYLLGLDNVNKLTGVVFGFIIVNGFADNVFSDYLWARSVVLTSPTVATIGMSITIPLAMISDYLLGNGGPTPISLFGAFLVVIGFLLVNVTREIQEDAVLWVRGKVCNHRPSASDGYVPVDIQ